MNDNHLVWTSAKTTMKKANITETLNVSDPEQQKAIAVDDHNDAVKLIQYATCCKKATGWQAVRYKK